MTFEMVNSSLQHKGEFVHVNTFSQSLVRVKPACLFLQKKSTLAQDPLPLPVPLPVPLLIHLLIPP